MSAPPSLQGSPRGRSGYQRIAGLLRRAIEREELQPGERLPSISELATRFETTAVTLRRALKELEDAGLVNVEHGVGSFVTRWIAPDEGLPGLPPSGLPAGLRTIILARGLLRGLPGTDRARSALELPEGSDVAYLVRARFNAGRPVLWQRSVLAPEMLQPVRDYPREASFYEWLRKQTGRLPGRAEERLSVGPPDPQAARALRLDPCAQIWVSFRLTRDGTGEPLVFDEAYILPEVLELELVREGARVETSFAWFPSRSTGEEG